MSVILVLGGARSGKSRYAEDLLNRHPAPIYLATGQAFDPEMVERIARHRRSRGEHWRTIEEPLALPDSLLRNSRIEQPILVDCLTLWLTNLMCAGHDIEANCTALIDVLPTLPGDVVLVSNEVGLGIVPDNVMARHFRDHAGRLHQRVAEIADRVAFIAAGLPLLLKGG